MTVGSSAYPGCGVTISATLSGCSFSAPWELINMSGLLNPSLRRFTGGGRGARRGKMIESRAGKSRDSSHSTLSASCHGVLASFRSLEDKAILPKTSSMLDLKPETSGAGGLESSPGTFPEDLEGIKEDSPWPVTRELSSDPNGPSGSLKTKSALECKKLDSHW